MAAHLDRLIVVGDKVLVKQKTLSGRSKGGLYLPPGVQEKDQILSGYVVKVGPGYPLPMVQDADEPWKRGEKEPRYLPLQAREGDLAIFLRSGAHEVEYRDAKYYMVAHQAILLLERDESLLA